MCKILAAWLVLFLKPSRHVKSSVCKLCTTNISKIETTCAQQWVLTRLCWTVTEMVFMFTKFEDQLSCRREPRYAVAALRNYFIVGHLLKKQAEGKKFSIGILYHAATHVTAYWKLSLWLEWSISTYVEIVADTSWPQTVWKFLFTKICWTA